MGRKKKEQKKASCGECEREMETGLDIARQGPAYCAAAPKRQRERQTFGRRRLPYLSDLDPICQAPFFACNVDLISIPNGF